MDAVCMPGSEGGASDDYWIILTLLSMEPEDLERHLPGRIPTAQSHYLKDGKYNPLIPLLVVMGTRYISWFDEYYTNEHCRQLLMRLFDISNERQGQDPKYFRYSRDWLYNSQWWNEVRQVARDILRISNAGFRPNIPEKVDPTQFDEFEPALFDTNYEILNPPFDPR